MQYSTQFTDYPFWQIQKDEIKHGSTFLDRSLEARDTVYGERHAKSDW